MATIDDLTPVLASAVENTDVMYVGLPLNADPDRQILVSQAKELFLPDNGVTNVRLRDSVALSVIGRAANSTGDPGDIAAATDGHVLRRSGTALGFGQVANAGIASGVDAAKIANGTVSNTEFQYLDGVTSGIQTQLGARALTSTTVSAGTGLTGGGSLAANRTISLADTGVTPVKTSFFDTMSASAEVLAGRFNSAGAKVGGSSGWTPSVTGTGQRRITHNLNTTNYMVVATADTGGGAPAYLTTTTKNENYVNVVTRNDASVLADMAFDFIIIRY